MEENPQQKLFAFFNLICYNFRSYFPQWKHVHLLACSILVEMTQSFQPPEFKIEMSFSSFRKERTTLWLKLPTVAFKVLELKKKKKKRFSSIFIWNYSPHTNAVAGSMSGRQVVIYKSSTPFPLFPQSFQE